MMRSIAIQVGLALAMVVAAASAGAQNAADGYRLYQFTPEVRGEPSLQACANCHGVDPNSPPANAVPRIAASSACGQNWPAGTVHSLKTICTIGANNLTAAQVAAIILDKTNTVPEMQQFGGGVLDQAQRESIAAYLLAMAQNMPPNVPVPQTAWPDATTVSSSVNFGAVNEGSTATQVVYFRNGGNAPLQLDASSPMAIAGLNGNRFSFAPALPAGETNPACAASATVNAGSVCAVAVIFSPDPTVNAGALQTASLTFRSNAGSGSTAANLNGSRVAPAAPVLTLNPTSTSYSFGPTAAGSSSAATTISLRNTGSAPLTVSAMTLVGTNAAEFALGGNCLAAPFTLAIGTSCDITLTFSPPAGATGTRTATLQIASNAAGSPLTINLNGTLAGSGTQIGFGSSSHTNSALLRLQSTGVGTAITGTVTVRNLGSQPLTITSLTLASGAPAFALSGETACTSAAVAPGGTCSVSVTYNPPNSATPHVGELSVVSNGLFGPSSTPGPHVVALEGVLGAGSGGLTSAMINRSQVSFPATPVSQMSVAQDIMITNGPAAALQASFSGAGGSNSSFVINSGNCANLVAAGSSCTISVQFRPRSVGSKSETLTISYNGGSMAVALSGIGQASNIADGKGGGGGVPIAWLLTIGLALFAASGMRGRNRS